MATTSLYEMPPNRNITRWMPAFPTHDDLKFLFQRLVAWCKANNLTIGANGLALGSFGTMVLDVDRDPSSIWDTFDPALPDADELDTTTRVQKAQLILDRLQSGGAAVTAAERTQLDIVTLRHLINEFHDGTL